MRGKKEKKIKKRCTEKEEKKSVYRKKFFEK